MTFEKWFTILGYIYGVDGMRLVVHTPLIWVREDILICIAKR